MTSSTGQVLFRDSDGIDREVDFLTAPLGLDTELDHDALPDKFRNMRLPQMNDELAAKRDHPQVSPPGQENRVLRHRDTAGFIPKP